MYKFTCQHCKFRTKHKLPMGGLMSSGIRVCTRTGAVMPKLLVYRKGVSGLVASREYPKGCNGNGYRA